MQSKSQLTNTNETWNAKKRYKINAVVTYLGKTYQNSTGANSIPTSNVDWIFLKSTSNSLSEKLQFTADGVSASYNIVYSATIKAVFWNSVLLNDDDWSQTGTTLTLTFIPSLGDLIKPI